MLRSNPILSWELTAVGRRQRYFWIRAAYSALLLFMLWSVYQGVFAFQFGSSARQFQHFATVFYGSFSLAQITMVLLLTPAYVATAIAVEKQTRTIEYLLATDLRNYEIVLGKVFARFFNVTVLIISALPIVACAMMFGSIDPLHIVVITLISVACAFSTASLAMLVSIHSSDTRAAIVQSYVALGLLLMLPLFVDIAESVYAELVDPNTSQLIPIALDTLNYLLQVSHPYTFPSSLQYGSLAELFESHQVLLMLAMHMLFSITCLTAAILRIRKVQLKERSKPAKRGARIAGRGIKEVSRYPMRWKEWYFGERFKKRWLLLLVQLLVWGGFYTYFTFALTEDFSGTTLNIYMRIAGTLLLMFGLLRVAVRAAGSIGAERDRDTWVSLLATPLTEEEILEGKLVGSLKPLYWTLIGMSPAYLISVFAGGLSILAVPLLMLEIAIYAYFVAAFGVYQSLVRKSTTSALGTTLTTLAVISGVGQLFSGCFIGILSLANIPSEWLYAAIVMSLPWTILGGSAFRLEDFNSFNEPTIIFFGVFFLISYAIAGSVLRIKCTTNFATITGRTRALGSTQ